MRHFEGKLKKLQLVSNNICFGPRPEPNDEVEQHLTITENGRIWLTRYRYGEIGSKKNIISRHVFYFSPETTFEILNAVVDYYNNRSIVVYATDVGRWDLTLTNTEGKIYKMSGPLCYDADPSLMYLSELIREKLGMESLFVFDGSSGDV